MEFALLTVGFMVGGALMVLLAEAKLAADARKIHVTVRSEDHGHTSCFRYVATDTKNHSAFAARPASNAIDYRWYTAMGDSGERILGWRQRVLNRALRNFRENR